VRVKAPRVRVVWSKPVGRALYVIVSCYVWGGRWGFRFRIRMEVTRKRGKVWTDLEACVELLKDVVAFSLSSRDFICMDFLWHDTRRVYVRRSSRCAGGGLPVSRCGGSPSLSSCRVGEGGRDQVAIRKEPWPWPVAGAGL